MNKTIKIHVLSEFRPFLRLLKAYNRTDFQHHDWRCILRYTFDVICATTIICSTPCFALLVIWYLIENGVDLKKIVVAVPIVITLVQTVFSSISLVSSTTRMDKMIDQMQTMVDRCEFFRGYFPL